MVTTVNSQGQGNMILLFLISTSTVNSQGQGNTILLFLISTLMSNDRGNSSRLLIYVFSDVALMIVAICVIWCAWKSLFDTQKLCVFEMLSIYDKGSISRTDNFKVVIVVTCLISSLSKIYLHHLWKFTMIVVEDHCFLLIKVFVLLPKIMLGNGIADVDLTEVPWQENSHGEDSNFQRYFSLGLEVDYFLGSRERQIQIWYDELIVFIIVVQWQLGGYFRILIWNPRIIAGFILFQSSGFVVVLALLENKQSLGRTDYNVPNFY